jgi:hypothetical protein
MMTVLRIYPQPMKRLSLARQACSGSAQRKHDWTTIRLSRTYARAVSDLIVDSALTSYVTRLGDYLRLNTCYTPSR